MQLAEDTEMHFYDAELLRLRAQTHSDPDAIRADLEAALAFARRQGASLFELRAASTISNCGASLHMLRCCCGQFDCRPTLQCRKWPGRAPQWIRRISSERSRGGPEEALKSLTRVRGSDRRQLDGIARLNHESIGVQIASAAEGGSPSGAKTGSLGDMADMSDQR